MSGLTVGSLSLTPAFDPAVTEYAVATTNATNKVTATAEDGSTVIVMLGETPLENGTAATWQAGENVLTITVSKDGAETEYTVTVTKS